MRKFSTKLMLTLALAFMAVGGAKARTVKVLGSPITFEQALAAESGSFALVQDGKVLCGPTSPSDNALTYKIVSDIDAYAYSIHFEEDGTSGNYFMALYDQAAIPALKGYINGSVWSHTYLSNIDKDVTKGERQDGALWSITETGSGTKVYTIKNVGVVGGNYNVNPNTGDPLDRDGQGFLACTTDGYWANHVTIYNTSGTWQFYSLLTTTLPDEDPVYFGWADLIFSTSEKVTVDPENRFVHDGNDWAPYGQETAKWEFAAPRDLSDYRYLVFYAKRNVTQWGNGENTTGGSVFIRDNNGTSFRCNDYVKYGDPAVDYPAHTGKMWMEIWNQQRATVIDLQWLANNDKYGNGNECKVLDITKIKAFGFAGDFCIGGAYLTNTLPNVENSGGDYSRKFTEEADPVYGNFGTICLNFNAVCCGAQLYQIVGKTASGITLEEYEGVMEAGKPYFYKTLEAKQQYWGAVHPETAVYFFKAGYATAASPVANNGLIGTFTNTTAPQGENYYVLSKNQLWQVNSTVNIGANKAYVDMDAITSSPAPELGTITMEVNGGDATGINEVQDSRFNVQGSEFYNIAGQRVAQPTKGLYIVNGKKVIIK